MAMLYIVHYTVLFHNKGGYYNSLILQALELPPWESGALIYDLILPVDTSKFFE